MLEREALSFRPLAERVNRLDVRRNMMDPDAPAPAAPAEAQEAIREVADRIRAARAGGRSVMCAFGAHAIKNGLGPVLNRLMEEGWLTHLATNGAGIVHDWEFAFQGKTGEDVARYVREGQFGLWQETGLYLNLALALGAYRGHGYGESVGRMIAENGLDIPDERELRQAASDDADLDRAAAALDLLGAVRRFALKPGWMEIAHPHKRFSFAAAAHRLGVPATGHPMFGHDIIYCHPMNHGAAIGRTAQRDFLTFADGVSRMGGGVYLSLGSAVMSPMIFEKSMSMAQNLAIQAGRRIEGHLIVVVDLARQTWDWGRQGEPPPDNPAYYLRFCKTFSRMGGAMRYVSADNRAFLAALASALRS